MLRFKLFQCISRNVIIWVRWYGSICVCLCVWVCLLVCVRVCLIAANAFLVWFCLTICAFLLLCANSNVNINVYLLVKLFLMLLFSVFSFIVFPLSRQTNLRKKGGLLIFLPGSSVCVTMVVTHILLMFSFFSFAKW